MNNQKICKHCRLPIIKDVFDDDPLITQRWKLRKGYSSPIYNPPNWCEDTKTGYTNLHEPMDNLEYLEYKYERSIK